MHQQKERIAVIGGGIIGVATAFYLNQSQRFRITLYDDTVGQATKATGGVVSPWLSRRRNKTWYQLVKTAAAFYPTFIQDIGLSIENNPFYKRTGSLLFKKKDAHLEEMLEIGLKRRQTAPEIGELKILSANEIRAIFPIYTGSARALYASGGAKVDGKAFIAHMLTLLAEQSVHIIKQRVNSLSINADDTYTLHTDKQIASYDKVVISAGAWANKLIEPLGYDVDQNMQKGQIAELTLDQVDSEDWPVLQPAGGFNVIPLNKSHFLIGATHEKDSGYTLDVVPELINPYIKEANRQISPAFTQSAVTAYRVGVRAYTSDFSPYFGKLPATKNIYTANGMGATGLTAGPLIGKILSQLILNQEPLLDPKSYHIDRYIQKK